MQSTKVFSVQRIFPLNNHQQNGWAMHVRQAKPDRHGWTSLAGGGSMRQLREPQRSGNGRYAPPRRRDSRWIGIVIAWQDRRGGRIRLVETVACPKSGRFRVALSPSRAHTLLWAGHAGNFHMIARGSNGAARPRFAQVVSRDIDEANRLRCDSLFGTVRCVPLAALRPTLFVLWMPRSSGFAITGPKPSVSFTSPQPAPHTFLLRSNAFRDASPAKQGSFHMHAVTVEMQAHAESHWYFDHPAALTGCPALDD